MDEKFKTQQTSFFAIGKEISSTVFESFEKVIKEQMEKQNQRLSKLEAGKCLLQEQLNSKQQGRTGTIRKVPLFKNKSSPC